MSGLGHGKTGRNYWIVLPSVLRQSAESISSVLSAGNRQSYINYNITGSCPAPNGTTQAEKIDWRRWIWRKGWHTPSYIPQDPPHWGDRTNTMSICHCIYGTLPIAEWESKYPSLSNLDISVLTGSNNTNAYENKHAFWTMDSWGVIFPSIPFFANTITSMSTHWHEEGTLNIDGIVPEDPEYTHAIDTGDRVVLQTRALRTSERDQLENSRTLRVRRGIWTV